MSSRSRAGGGLPSGPGPRSRSVARTRDADRGRYDDDSDGGASSRPSTRQVRPQKSMTSMNQSRSDPRPPPMPSSRSRRNPNPSYDSRERPDPGPNRSSDSTTSSASSFFDRMKQSAGYASSRTSLEDDEPDKRPARSMRNRPTREESPPPGMGYCLIYGPSRTDAFCLGRGRHSRGRVHFMEQNRLHSYCECWQGMGIKHHNVCRRRSFYF
jgi:hypothetical protein